MLLVPPWDGGGGDGVVRQLVDVLLRVLGPLGPEEDVRKHMTALRSAMESALDLTPQSVGGAASPRSIPLRTRRKRSSLVLGHLRSWGPMQVAEHPVESSAS